MPFFSGLETSLLSTIQSIYDAWGWFGVAALLAFENATGIMPGEIILGLAGWILIEAHQLPPSMIFVGGFYTAVGCAIGASVTYWVARLGGRPLIDKLVRWVRMNPSHIDRAEAQFQRWGAGLTLFGRFIPGLRVLISVPAGLARMSFATYFIATFMGVYIYCTLIIGAGYLVGHEWSLVVAYGKQAMPYLITAGIAALAIYALIIFRSSLLEFFLARSNEK
jgi:membrane protein DedA with SNARE-associated domain